MRIVNIEEDFHPAAGYQLNLLTKYFSEMGHEVIIVTCEPQFMKQKFTNFFGNDNLLEQDKQYENKYGVKIYRKPVYGYFNRKNFFKFGFLKYLSTFKFIKSLKPDILYVHGNVQTISILAFLLYRYMDVPYITDSHMVEMALEGNKRELFFSVYRKIISPIIVKKGIRDIRTQNEDFVGKYLGIPLSQAPWISVGSDTMLFHKDEKANKKFRRENKIADDEFVIIYAGKLDWEKGGRLLADAFLEKFEGKKVVLLVVGNATTDAYGNEVEMVFKESHNRIIRFPTQKYEDLASFYQAADLGVFPRQCSLSFYDIQACGVPIVSENNNINYERLQHSNGWYFESGDVEDFRRVINEILMMPSDDYSEIRKNAEKYVIENYDYKNISKQYLDEIQASIDRFKSRRKK